MDEKIKFMKEALKEAQKSYKKEEIPVGAIIVKDGKIIARGHNLKETKTDPTKHAEMDEKTGACGSVLNLLADYKFNHIVQIETGIMQEECKTILQQFFKELRARK